MKVLFVCTANTCRSPMLEYMFKQYAYARDKKDIEVASAGLVLHDDIINPLCARVLDAHGVPYDASREAKFCDKKTFSSATFVFTMNDEQKRVLAKFYGAEKKILSLSTYLGYDVPDPYGLSLDAYEQIYKTFSAVLCEIFAKCEKKQSKNRG